MLSAWKSLCRVALIWVAVGATSLARAAETVIPLGLPPVPIPHDSPQTHEKVLLGKALFEDARLSADGTVSCATCHRPELAFTDGLAVSKGVRQQQGTRSAPSLLNAAYSTSQFWDGRRESLEAQ